MAEKTVIEKEMGISHADFFRILPGALGSGAYTVSGNRFTFKEGARVFTIDLGEEGVRQIALMRMPQTKIKLTFEGYDAEAREQALARFWRYFQKGGG